MRWAFVVAVVVAVLASFSRLTIEAGQEVTGDTRLLAVARYVAFGFDAGDGFVSDADSGKMLGVSQEDRAALVAVRTQFEKWHRYVVTNFPGNADLLVAVRAGRSGHIGGQVPVGGGRPAGTGVRGGDAGASSPDDMLSVYSNMPVGGRQTRSLVWRRSLADGLAGTSAPLFEQFRAAVEAASK